MNRQIQQKPKPGVITAQAQQKEDAYLDKVIKLIPTDVVGVYLGVFTLIKQMAPKPGDDALLQWSLLILITIIMPFYLKYAGVKDKKQIWVSILSFYVWVLSLGGPLYYLPNGLYSPQFIGSLLVPVYTLLIPLLTYPSQTATPAPIAPVPPVPDTVTNPIKPL